MLCFDSHRKSHPCFALDLFRLVLFVFFRLILFCLFSPLFMTVVLYYFLIINLATFVLYGVDKKKSVKQQ